MSKSSAYNWWKKLADSGWVDEEEYNKRKGNVQDAERSAQLQEQDAPDLARIRQELAAKVGQPAQKKTGLSFDWNKSPGQIATELKSQLPKTKATITKPYNPLTEKLNIKTGLPSVENAGPIQSRILAGGTGFINSFTMGMANQNDQKLKQATETLSKKYPVESTIGGFAGYAVPGTLAETGIKAALKPLVGEALNKLAYKIGIDALTGGTLSGIQSINEGANPQQIGENVALGGLMGGGLGTLFRGAGKALTKTGIGPKVATGLAESKIGQTIGKIMKPGEISSLPGEQLPFTLNGLANRAINNLSTTGQLKINTPRAETAAPPMENIKVPTNQTLPKVETPKIETAPVRNGQIPESWKGTPIETAPKSNMPGTQPENITVRQRLSTLREDFKTAAETDKVNIMDEVELLMKMNPNDRWNTNLQLFGKGDKLTVNPDVEITGPDTSQSISSRAGGKSTITQKMDKIYTKTFDNLYNISKFTEKAKITDAAKDPYLLAMNSRNYDGVALTVLKDAMVDKTGKVTGKSLNNILKKIPTNESKAFSDYLINRHALEWMEPIGGGKAKKVFADKNVTPEIIKQRISDYEARYPEFNEIGSEFVQFHRELTKNWLVDTGLLSPEQFKTFLTKYPEYIPFKRGFTELEKAGGFTGKKGYVNQTSPVKKATGSERQIIDPIESYIEDVYGYVKTAKRNEVGQAIYKAVKENPEGLKNFAEIVPEGEKFNVNQTIENEGIEGVISNLDQAFEKVKLNTSNVVKVLVDGKPVHMKINDMAFLESLTSLNPAQQNLFIEAFRGATNTMKNLTTGLNPMFGLFRNLWRDVATGHTQSKTSTEYVLYIKDLVKSVVDMVGRKPAYKEFKALGGGFHASPISADRNLANVSKAQLLKGGSVGRKAKAPLRAIESFNAVIETAPRLAEYKRTVKQGMKKGMDEYSAKQKGIFEASEATVNFRRFGDTAKTADAFVPYLNAALQGIDKFRRTFDFIKNPKQAAIATGKAIEAVTIPSLILYAMNHKDKNYNQLSDYIKDGYFCIPKGDGTFWKIPKPREIGVVFGAVPERLASQIADQDPEAWKRFTETVKANFVPPTEPIFMPAYDIFSSDQGKDWRGNPIVSTAESKLSPRYQYDQKTSEISKGIGDKFNLSPKKLDAFAKSYLGVVAQIGIPANAKGSSVGKVITEQMTADPLFSNDIMNDFYDYLDKATVTATDYNYTENIASKVVTRKEEVKNALTKISTAISDERKLYKSAKTDEARKASQQKMIDLARQGIERAKSFGVK
jgi:hypothetical protein